nr:autotransporter-associated N-terminal domain-containing protein [uncultured Leptotrichia sp.]
MAKNLKELRQELKSFAKKVKDFKYTDSALITFLLTGAIGRGAPANLFSDGNKVETQTKAINVSVAQRKKDFKKVKRENEKLIKNTDLELVQLMEQGDYAVKLPWGGWQYGVSGNYNNWKGHYKGRGDKVKNIKYTRGRNTSDKKTVADDNVGAVHASNGETITMNRTSLPSTPNISIANGIDSQTKKNAKFGLFANNGSIINAQKNWIKVTDSPMNIVSLNNAKIDLEGSKVEYKGNGYALYTDSTSNSEGAINMKDATLVLDGKAIGYVFDQARPNAVSFNNTNIDVLSDDAVIAELTDSKSPLVIDVENKAGNDSLKSRLLRGNVNITSSNGKTNYKYALADDATIQIKSAIDKANLISDSDSEVFTKRFLYQNSRLHVEAYGSVKAELNTAQMKAIDDRFLAPVGLAIAGSSKSVNNRTTEIGNKGRVFVDRTDAGQGGIGFYADYGWLNNYNAGKLEVEQGATHNDRAVGMYGTNNSNMVSSGPINVGGKNSIGILGLSYRIDPSTGLAIDPSNEPYFRSAENPANFGKIDIMNLPWGTITMDDDGAIGIFTKNNSIDPTIKSVPSTSKAWLVGVNEGTITINGNNHAIGMGSSFGAVSNYEGEDPVTHVYHSGIININGSQSFGMYGTNNTDLKNFGIINVAATTPGNESIGMYGDDPESKVYMLEEENGTRIRNNSIINVGRSSYGIFARNIEMNGGTINVGDDGVGIYSQGPDVNLIAGKINVGNDNAVGVYIDDTTVSPKPAIVKGNLDMKVGQNSVGFLITAANIKTELNTKAPNDVHIGENSVYIYSRAPQGLGGKIENKSNIVTDGNNSYGIYSSQDFINRGNIDLRSGTGNVGIYSAQGVGQNYGTIEVGPSDAVNGKYGIGMATGSTAASMGTIENHGIINVTKDNSVGMYASGSGAKAVNRGTINLEGNDTVGMYIDNHAAGENYGTIQTTASGNGIKGVVTKNGGIIKNYGTINIVGSSNTGVETDTTSTYQEHGTNNSTNKSSVGTAVSRTVAEKLVVKVPAHPSPVSIPIPAVTAESLGDNANVDLPQVSGGNNHANKSSIEMYVDTSGINHTNPIQGLNNLARLTDIDLIMGTEAARNTNAKVIQIGDNILQPYNDALGSVMPTGVKLNVDSASLTWRAKMVESGNLTAPMKTVYMEKIPYTDFANKTDTDAEHFLDGLEQRYGVEDVNSREKQVFNKLNDLRNDEDLIFTQAISEMLGYEYSNTQQRINETGNELDKEIGNLQKEWRNTLKQNNKIKVFGAKDEYNTDTAGVVDYDSNAYGVAYMHEDETIEKGNSKGWYAGAVTNRFKFKDLGKSTEQQSMIKAGAFKTMSPKNDYNSSLEWTVAGDVFGGINNMHRKFWVVDDVFESEANYYTYGAAVKNELGYDIRLSERAHLRPYGILKIEYGRFTNIKENNGQMKLEVKGNDYFSVKPEVGAEFKYIQPLTAGTQLSAGLSAAYENELGKLNRLNQARVRYTTADWYNLKNEKEDRKGNIKFGLNVGINSSRFGVTANLGYDTKGKNIREGLGFKLNY